MPPVLGGTPNLHRDTIDGTGAPAAGSQRASDVRVDFGPAGVKAIKADIPHTQGMTALEALQAVAKVELTDTDGTHPQAIDAVNGVRTDLANSRFWMLDVNGHHAQKMPQDIVLLPGFEVEFSYMTPPVAVTIDYGPAARRPAVL